ncbi:MAG: sodium:solute symporter family protein [Pseudomonadota bacterium]
MSLFAATIAVSVVLFIVIGTYSGRRIRSIDDYFVAGRRAPTLFITGTLVASVFSTTIFLGEAGFTYAGQLGAYLLLPGVAVTGYVYGALFFGTFLRRSRAPTVADYFGQRFQSRRVQQFAGLTIVLGLGGYLLVVTQGAALLLVDILGVSYQLAVVIAWVSYTLFTLYSGSQGVVLTDTLMFLLFTVATIFFGFALLDHVGGVQFAIEELTRREVKPQLTTWHGTIGEGTPWATPFDFFIWFVIIDIAWSIVYAVSPWQSSRHLMARSEHVVLRAAIYACLAVIGLQILIYGAGGIVNLANPNIEPVETVMLWAAQNLVPEWLGALLVAGIVAAGLSSASTFLSLVGFSVSNDLARNPGELKLRTTRICMAAVALTVLVLALLVPANVFWITLFIGTVFASSWGPMAFMSIWSRRITAPAAFWGMVTGFMANVIPAALVLFEFLTLPSYADPALLGLATGLLTIWWVSARTEATAGERQYQEALHVTPPEDRDPAQCRKTLIAPLMLCGYGLVMPFLMLTFYVLPYQRGSGEVAVDGGLNWQFVEPWIAFGPAVLFIPLGLISFLVIRRRYAPSALGSSSSRESLT